jgi:hypothetical protein
MIRYLLAGAACLALCGVAEARPIPDKGMTVEEVAAFVKSAGFDPKIQKSDQGQSYVHATTEGGVNFDIDLYDCTEGRCRALQFVASFDLKAPMTAAKVNEWNMTKRYLRAYIDANGDPTFLYDANVAPGGTYEALQDDLDVFLQFLPDVLEHIGWGAE